VIFALSLSDGGGNVAGLAWRRDKVNGAVTQSFKIFIPIGQTGCHYNRNPAFRNLSDRKKIVIGTISESTLAEHEPNISLGNEITALD
jgi:hypothetical protein